jgi:hypothetical protein
MKVNPAYQEIEITQQDVRQLKARLSNYFNYYWELHSTTPEQIADVNQIVASLEQAIGQLENLKGKI